MEIPVDRRTRQILTFLVAGGLIAVALLTVKTNAQTPAPPNPRAFFDTYCITCHNQKLRTAGLALDTLDVTKPAANAEILEKVIGKLRAGSMPPPGNAARRCGHVSRRSRPRSKTQIDQALGGASQSGQNRRGPSPQSRGIQQRDSRPVRARRGREAAASRRRYGGRQFRQLRGRRFPFRRLTWSATCRWRARSRGWRRACLPPSRSWRRFEIPLHVLQEDRQSEDLPFGSRGGIAVHYDFPVDGEYLIKVRLQRQYQDYLKGMGWPQQLDVRLDGKLLKRFTVGGAGQGQARGGELRRRRRAGLCGRSRMGNLHAAHRRRRPGSPRPGARRVREWSACRS